MMFVNKKIWPLFQVKFDALNNEGPQQWEIESAFFKEHVKAASYMCYVMTYKSKFCYLINLKNCLFLIETSQYNSLSAAWQPLYPRIAR